MISITVFSTFEGERSGCLNSSRNRSRRHLPNSLCSRSFGIYGQFNLNGDFDGCCRRQFHLSASLRCQMVFVRIGYCSADMTFTIPCSTYEFRIHAKLCRNGNYFHSPELSQSPMVRKFSSQSSTNMHITNKPMRTKSENRKHSALSSSVELRPTTHSHESGY